VLGGQGVGPPLRWWNHLHGDGSANPTRQKKKKKKLKFNLWDGFSHPHFLFVGGLTTPKPAMECLEPFFLFFIF
jgi:hypothetical protein